MGERRAQSFNSGIGVGISSILMIFVALCLTIFATLSYLSARADGKLTERFVAATESYYAADAAAEETLAAIADAMAAGGTGELLALGVEWQERPEGLWLSYDIPAGERRTLHVEALYDPTLPERFERQVWKIVVAEEPMQNEGPPLLQNLPDLG